MTKVNKICAHAHVLLIGYRKVWINNRSSGHIAILIFSMKMTTVNGKEYEMEPEGNSYGYTDNFSSKKGFIYCEGVCIKALKGELLKSYPHPSPFYVFSKQQIIDNINSYKLALEHHNLPYSLGFAIKANYNPSILEIMRSRGCTAVAVSGAEVLLALKVGMDASNIIFNGNGKLDWEIDLAVSRGCFLNVDSAFDLEHTIVSCRKLGKKGKIILRLNPDIDACVHPYLATGVAKSKFGIEESKLEDILATANEEPLIKVVGLHCHLGSTITNTKVFRECLDVLLGIVAVVRKMGITTLKYLNVGGGLGIDYKKHSYRTSPCAPCQGNMPHEQSEKKPSTR